MEKMRVISQIEKPSDWCAGMVVVSKHNGEVRLCVDLTKLNESIRRETHPPLSGANTRTDWGSKVFFKARRKLQILADRAEPWLSQTHNLYHPIWEVPLQSITIQDNICPRTLSEKNDTSGRGYRRCCLPCWRHPSKWKNTRGTRSETHDCSLLSQWCWDNLGIGEVRFLGQLVDETGVKLDPEKVQAIIILSNECSKVWYRMSSLSFPVMG